LIPYIPGLTDAATADQQGAIITYPSGYKNRTNETYPLLFFGHGAFVTGKTLIGDGYHTLFTTVASYGFIVVAPLGCKFCNFEHDMLATATACKENVTLHPALAAADFSRQGFFGHSNGARGAQHLAGKRENVDKYNIKAAVSMHCGCDDGVGGDCLDYGPAGSNLPFMYVNTDGDDITRYGFGSKNGYNKGGDGDKILWIAKGGSHFEPADSTIPNQPDGSGGANREDQPIAFFFACHVRGEHCDNVYGTSGDAICQNNMTQMSVCKVHRPGQPPSPTPSPPPGPACRTPDVTDACWKAMGESCSERGGTSCLVCLANPSTIAKTKAAGCPQTPAGKVAQCFCSQHLDESIV
jgi:hypothetical protein